MANNSLQLWEVIGVWFAGLMTLAAVILSLVLARRSKPREPDWSMREAFRHVLLNSKFALRTDPEAEGIYTNAELAIRDAARGGRIEVWGRPPLKAQGGFGRTLIDVPPEEWNHLVIDLPSVVCDSAMSAMLTGVPSCKAHYEYVMVNKGQVLTLWPRANWWQRHRDPMRKPRLEWFDLQRKRHNG